MTRIRYQTYLNAARILATLAGRNHQAYLLLGVHNHLARLESIEPGLEGDDLSVFVKRLLEALPGRSTKGKAGLVDESMLSARELDVLGLLADGKSYKETGERLFLSLHTVQCQVKSIYHKLSVNKRVQAIEKARRDEFHLITEAKPHIYVS